MTNRETVTKVEKMKVCTCLNPLHTALSLFGCMLGYIKVSEIMTDKDLVKLVKVIAEEGMPVVSEPGIISPEEFVDTVINLRLPNPFIPDTPQRIVMDTSKKMHVRFGETLKSYMSRPELDVDALIGIPLTLAGWLRYLLALDDEGKEMAVSPDPMLEQLQSSLEGIRFGSPEMVADKLRPLLSNPVFFGVDLYEAGIAGKTEELFKNLIAGPGAVRATLKKYLS
jgi:fructuronate reductase